MKINSSIYVAGHTGLLGSAIVHNLQSKGYEHIITRTHSELDLTRQSDVEDFFYSQAPEYIFLAAAKVGGILANNTYKADFIYDNIMIASNIIHAAYRYKSRKLLNLGSSCIYPKLAPQPIKEEYLLTGVLEPTNEPYAISKISAIKLCRYFNDQHGTDFMSVMPTNIFGPNDNFNLETAHVLPALIRKFHLARLLKIRDFDGIKKDLSKYPLGFGMKINGTTDEQSIESCLNKIGISKNYVLLWGRGTAFREFLYVDSLANACTFLMENYNHDQTGEFINIGSGRDIQINHLALLIRDIVGFDGEIKHDFSKPEGTPRKLLDITKIKSLGWEPGTDLKTGIKLTYEWYVNSV